MTRFFLWKVLSKILYFFLKIFKNILLMIFFFHLYHVILLMIPQSRVQKHKYLPFSVQILSPQTIPSNTHLNNQTDDPLRKSCRSMKTSIWAKDYACRTLDHMISSLDKSKTQYCIIYPIYISYDNFQQT